VLDRRLIGVCTQQASGFLEDGLQLWHALVQAAPTAAPDALWDLFPAACALLALQGESEFRLVVDVLQSYLLLEPRPAIVEVRLTRMGSPSSHAAPLLMHVRRWGGGTGPGGGAGRAAGRGVCAAAVGPQNDRGRLGRCGPAQRPVPLRRNDGVNDMHGTGVCVCVSVCVCVCVGGRRRRACVVPSVWTCCCSVTARSGCWCWSPCCHASWPRWSISKTPTKAG
jgi:hypothetical protein